MIKQRSLHLIALACLSLFFSALHAATITARTDRNPVQMNESISLVFEATGSVDDDPDFSPLEKDFDIINQSQSSNISIINGNMNRQKTWSLIIMPKQPGVFTIPSIAFGKDSSPQIRLTVKPASQNSSTSNQPFFTELNVDTQQTYVQGQIIVTQRMYSSANIARYGFGELKTHGPDTVIETIGDEKQYQTKLGITPYLVIERNYALFPQASGTLEIEPALVEASVASSTSNNYLDPFRRNTTIKRARSEGHSIRVKDVPASFRGKTWLPAAEVQLVEEWSNEKKQFKVGEPITRTLSIFADGLMGAQLPKIPLTEVDGLKQYPDKPVINDNKKTDGIIGGRQEKVAI
ncbi:MAG: BatD family protein, partial [Gammaproteobacteria bacterium]|nr:BatD family protein [Gammaproteobacteria bacterium]